MFDVILMFFSPYKFAPIGLNMSLCLWVPALRKTLMTIKPRGNVVFVAQVFCVFLSYSIHGGEWGWLCSSCESDHVTVNGT